MSECPKRKILEDERETNVRAFNTAKELKEGQVPNAEMMLAKAQKDVVESDVRLAGHINQCEECKRLQVPV